MIIDGCLKVCAEVIYTVASTWLKRTGQHQIVAGFNGAKLAAQSISTHVCMYAVNLLVPGENNTGSLSEMSLKSRSNITTVFLRPDQVDTVSGRNLLKYNLIGINVLFACYYSLKLRQSQVSKYFTNF